MLGSLTTLPAPVRAPGLVATVAPVASADRLVGTLLGTAVGDALGVVVEGCRGDVIARRFPELDRYGLWPFVDVGIVSDDTEQSALVAQALLRSDPGDPAPVVRAFRRSLAGWFLRLPWGLGLATLRACVRILFGFQHSGVHSAGNGAAMRAAIVGVYFADDAEARRHHGEALARVTHTDVRAVESALFVAELAAGLSQTTSEAQHSFEARRQAVTAALGAITNVELETACVRAIDRVAANPSIEPDELGRALGNTGFVLHTLPLAIACFLRDGDHPLRAVVTAIGAGGDTDTTAAIVGAWAGALHGAGPASFPPALFAQLQRGPFGEVHLRALGEHLAAKKHARAVATGTPSPSFRWPLALLRNLGLYPVVVTHALLGAVGLWGWSTKLTSRRRLSSAAG
jgi:ADP-ribosyl-[dinitrogen reductase] hydrolase